jgi:hypothetical protein
VDGSYADTSWEQQRLFDREEPEPLESPLCPFHSDYTPARMTGYGCDVSVLQSIISAAGDGALPFAEAEMEGLQKIEDEIDSFREIIPLLQAATGDSGSGPPPTPEHQTVFGCAEEIGACSGDDLVACSSDEFCASKDKGFCVKNTSKPTIPKRSIRGPFSYPTDHLRLMTEFVQKRIDDGFSRTFPNEWRRASDIPASDSGAVADRENDSSLVGAARTVTRVFFQSISGIQGRREGAVFAEATDSQLEIADALSDMRASIGELSRLASQKAGVRSFVIELAYFLRRTCAFRPCQRSLEQVIRIALEDACFPYTNGQFLKDTGENPRWKKCALAACIQVDDTDGQPLDLPESCDEILP